MAAVVHKIEREVFLPDGSKMVVGTIKLSANYYAGGDSLNLANYFANAACTPVVGPANGWCLEANLASSALPGSLKIVARSSTGNAKGTPLQTECDANVDLSSCNAALLVFGQAK